MQYVQQLPFILVEPLHLHVEDSVRVQLHSLLPVRPPGKGLLVAALDLLQPGTFFLLGFFLLVTQRRVSHRFVDSVHLLADIIDLSSDSLVSVIV